MHGGPEMNCHLMNMYKHMTIGQDGGTKKAKFKRFHTGHFGVLNLVELGRPTDK